MQMSDFWKEILKFAVAAVLAAVVFVAGVNLILLPQANRLSTEVARLTGLVATQDKQLSDNQEKIDTLNQQVIGWEKSVGILLSDQKLTVDLRASLEALRGLPQEKMDFLTGFARLSKAIRTDPDGAVRIGFGEQYGNSYQWTLELFPKTHREFPAGTIYVVECNPDGSPKASYRLARSTQ